jgi:histidinol phosphatase-like PHP family hydrolase
MQLTSDWHIHSRNSCDEASLALVDLLADAQVAGVSDLGVTDHVHTPFNLPDLDRSRAEFVASAPPSWFHFGVEVSCVSQWELDLIRRGGPPNPVYGVRAGGPAAAPLALGITAEELSERGVEYVVGGTHWPMYVPMARQAVIQDYHRQNLFLATHPLVDVVAHPWWWHGAWADSQGNFTTDPWLGDFAWIPASMHDEFRAAAKQHSVKVEINLSAMLLNPHYPTRFKEQYAEYLAWLKEGGVMLSLGSDCHDHRYQIDFGTAAAMLDRVGIRDGDLWRLPRGPQRRSP